MVQWVEPNLEPNTLQRDLVKVLWLRIEIRPDDDWHAMCQRVLCDNFKDANVLTADAQGVPNISPI